MYTAILTPINLALIGATISAIALALWRRAPDKKHQKIGVMALETFIEELPKVAIDNLKLHLTIVMAAYDLAKSSLADKDKIKLNYAQVLISIMAKVEPFSAEWELCREALNKL